VLHRRMAPIGSKHMLLLAAPVSIESAIIQVATAIAEKLMGSLILRVRGLLHDLFNLVFSPHALCAKVTHTQTCTNRRIRTHIEAHTRTHTYTHTHTHTLSHIHKQTHPYRHMH
jgi:hypothetical protein